jgi:hypothetical protein
MLYSFVGCAKLLSGIIEIEKQKTKDNVNEKNNHINASKGRSGGLFAARI